MRAPVRGQPRCSRLPSSRNGPLPSLCLSSVPDPTLLRLDTVPTMILLREFTHRWVVLFLLGCCSACLARSRLPSLRPIIKVSPGGHPYVTPQPAASAPALAAPPPQRIHGLHYCDYLNPSRTEWAGPPSPDIRRITLPAGSTSFLALIDIIADRIGVSVTDVLSYVDSAGDKITVIIFFLAQ